MLVYNNDWKRLCRVLIVVLLFQLHNSIRTRQYLHRPVIVSPSDSPWQRLYEQAYPSSFLHMTGLTWQCFVMLLSALFDHEEILPHLRHWRGRPRSLRPEGCLGLLLFYLGRCQGSEREDALTVRDCDIGPLINLGTQHDGRSARTWMKRVLTTFVVVMGGRKGFAREHQNGFYET